MIAAKHLVVASLTIAGLCVPCAGSASAAEPAPGWSVRSTTQPTNFQPGDAAEGCIGLENSAPGPCDFYTVVLTNTGAEASDGSTITLTDTLPPGITTAKTPFERVDPISQFAITKWNCSPGAGQTVVTCTTSAAVPALNQADAIEIPIAVDAGVEQGVLENHLEASGGGAASPAAGDTPTPISAALASFGPIDFTASALDPGGALDTAAAGHPGALVAAFDFPSASTDFGAQISAYPLDGAIRQTIVDLPAGLVGNPQAAPRCTLTDLANFGDCPADTQVGILGLVEPPLGQPGAETNLPIFNIVPEHGYPAEFGVFDPILERAALLYASVVGNGAETHVRVTSQNLPRALPLNGVSTVFFGDPAVKDGTPTSPIAFATAPADCSQPSFTTTIHIDSWNHPGATNADGTPDFSDPNWKRATAQSPPVSGCGKLQFNPTISLQPDTSQPSSPAGLNVDLQVPQTTDPSELATPPLRTATVTLPEGMSVSPSAAEGLQGCSDAQLELGSNDPPSCPEGSEIGTVLVHTPLLDHTLPGVVYLGTPLCGPCTDADAADGRMLRLFMVIDDPVTGTVVKLPGTVMANPGTGQLTATFADNPQLPFDDLKLAFKSGPRATLSTPASCGTFTSTADLSPWSAPFTPDALLQSSFTIAGCGAPQFAPSFTAQTVNNQAGAFSPFTLSFSRQDADQQFSALSVTLPPGVLAKLAGVPLCPDADANAGSCPGASQVGSVSSGAGPGSHPFFLPGKVFLTGPYRGGPYGLVVEVPAIAGPFNLGTVVVRQAIYIDPHTAQASVVSNPLPRILDGIPLQIRAVDVTIDRPGGFTFNATSCEPMQVAATLTSIGGRSAPVSSRYQSANCSALPFRPSFKVSTQGKTSKANGASLNVKVGQGAGEAHIHRVDVSLPLALPSRLTTLQKACAEAQFAANPAGCPDASNVGTAVARTPVLNAPLMGPAYLVSHGGAAFPDLDIVLQGEGITIDLTGNTDIKKGITFSRFETVPDAPISSFELNLPEGPHSALAANRSLCSPTKLVTKRERIAVRRHGRTVHVMRSVKVRVPEQLLMPTTIFGQNGTEVRQSTKIGVTGCPKKTTVEKKGKAKKHSTRKRKKRQ